MLEVIYQNKLPLDRIVHVEIMATKDIPADLPPMMEFKAKADAIIYEKYGIRVEHIIAPTTYEWFYHICKGKKSRNTGKIYGFPLQKGNWCNSRLKQSVLEKVQKNAVVYIGIAVDEPKRFHNLTETKRSPLVEYDWTEKMCRDWCKENDLLSPIYTQSLRGGCWFCYNQGINQLRKLRKNYPELWALLLKWDKDSPVLFKADGHTVMDYDLEQDENSRVACEVMLAHNKCFISGEITTTTEVDYEYIARSVIAQVGYDPSNIEVEIRIHKQSTDIAAAVDGEEQGAGDQGIVYGYATDETINYMPLPVELAHRLTNCLEECRRNNIITGLRPDGKSQVSIQYRGDRFDKITSVVISAQHDENKDLSELTAEIREKVIGKELKEYDLTDAEILINPSGRFVIGGFEADTGLTGRKLMVDTYGGIAHHGGGALSGKDTSKVDRSGAYFARYIAKNIVAAGLAEKCEVALSYAIVVPGPTAIDVNTFYISTVNERLIAKTVEKVFDLSVVGTIEKLDLRRPVFSQTAVGGHFGKNFLACENTDKTEALNGAIKA